MHLGEALSGNANTWTGCSAPTLICWRFFEEAYQMKA
jgi:hypothetical protein